MLFYLRQKYFYAILSIQMPKTSASKTTSDFAPLLKGLRQIESRLESEGESRILVAAKNRKEFERQKLESHQIVTPCKLQGPRVHVRDRRHLGQARIVEAHWPKDGMLEAAQPTLYFIISGQMDMRIADYSVHCWPGDSVFFPAGVPKADGSIPSFLLPTPASVCSFLMFSPGQVAGYSLECSLNHSRDKKQIPGNVDERCWIKNVHIAQIYAMLSEELQNYGNTKSTFYSLLLLLGKMRHGIEAGKAMVGWPFSAFTKLDAKEDLIRRAMQYINDHLDEHLTIDAVARQIGVSRTVLTREFRKETDDTFTHYVIAQRMSRAEVLLKEANLPVNRVGKEVGLSTARLRSLFQQKHQCSPDHFRNSY
jgi:AraC-like DNA-binding protein